MQEVFKKASFLDGFELPEITYDNVKSALLKVGQQSIIKKRNSIEGLPLSKRLESINSTIKKVLGRYEGFIKVIRSDEEFKQYIDFAIQKDYLSFDTETDNSLDPLTCKIMGLCCYIKNTKPVYIPINHCIPETDTLLENQVSMECVIEAFKKLKENNTKLIYHNGKFDIRVCYNNSGIYLPIYWDTMIAAQLLDENELARLKYQYKVHINPTMDSYNIENIFTGLPYSWIDPGIFAYYAAIDAYDTALLQEYQQNIFEKSDMQRLYNVFKNVEIPIVLVTAKMEDYGINIDKDFCNKLDKKYEEKLNEASEKLDNLLQPYKYQIKSYQEQGKLDNPINYDSAKQLSIVLYDIIKIKDDSSKKATDKNTLKNLKNPITDTVLEYRHYAKLRSAFTQALPSLISEKDNKIHASFNQMGKEDNNVRTGRFSSTSPNLQQIPSKEGILRMMFTGSVEYGQLVVNNNDIELDETNEIQTQIGWKFVKDLIIGDKIMFEDGTYGTILNIEKFMNIYKITYSDFV